MWVLIFIPWFALMQWWTIDSAVPWNTDPQFLLRLWHGTQENIFDKTLICKVLVDLPIFTNLFLKCGRLMASFGSWKGMTLGQSTLETQVVIQFPSQNIMLFNCSKHIITSSNGTNMGMFSLTNRWIYHEWTCWDRKGGPLFLWFVYLLHTSWVIYAELLKSWQSLMTKKSYKGAFDSNMENDCKNFKLLWEVREWDNLNK